MNFLNFDGGVVHDGKKRTNSRRRSFSRCSSESSASAATAAPFLVRNMI